MSGPYDAQTEALYAQLAHNAARLMVVHEAGRISRSTHDAKELAQGLLDAIAEAVFAASGCVAGLAGDELKILATRGLAEEEVAGLTENETEAGIWFGVADGAEPIGRADAAALTGAAETGFELYIPLRVEDDVMGVLALGPRVDRKEYGADDRELAMALGSHLALALNSARLFAERNRKIEQLSVLLRISREITSTLDLERVLGTIAHMIGMILPNRRTTVALTTGDAVSLKASSEDGFDAKTAGKDRILPALRWALGAHLKVNTSRAELEANTEAAGRDVLLPLLSEEGGPRGLAILLLEDDQGVLGLLAIETDSDLPPLDDDREELIDILANQTTVAIRNAELYQRMPMMGVFAPMLGKKRSPTDRKRFLTRAAVAFALLLAGFLVPFPAWVSGDAAIRPGGLVPLRAGTAGIIEEIFVREGERVPAGTRVAQLREDDTEVRLEQVRAGLSRSRTEALRAQSQGDLAVFQAKQAEIGEMLRMETYFEEELGRTALVSPIDGIVLTPRVDLRTGSHLERGETLLEVADVKSLEVDVFVPQADVDRVADGAPMRLKVHAFPNRTWKGSVARVAPRGEGKDLFRVTVKLENLDGELRPGMTGRAHINAPARPLLVSLLGPAVRWVRLKLWV
jgi:RND family efflux transporter MFP subunit